ncbi:MAG: hypothetical protein V4710_21840, partial [Verrucomicrobiota bacterium]
MDEWEGDAGKILVRRGRAPGLPKRFHGGFRSFGQASGTPLRMSGFLAFSPSLHPPAEISGKGIGVRLIGDERHQVDLVAAAAEGEVVAEFIEVGEIGFPQLDRVEQVPDVALFQAIELGPVLERKFELIAIPDLEDEDLMMGMPEMGERLEQGRDIAETIRNDHKQTTPVQLGDQIMK